ncbi:24531_t:CDS:2 [Dentiscutata erythropus]|uniref:24531_t:CDS:1 n=1 Tax=Dentiscutata erythropus TaxID=1348616 RepID=A0A9N9EGB6_9GLOM|nr:24531_t:CDS:2 [Dentiscutata erythropus]
MNNIQDSIDDLETDNETDIDDNNSSEIGPSSKGNKTTDFSLELSNDNEDSNDEDDVLLDSENEDDTHLHAPLLPPDLDQIEKQFKIAISDSLNKYWMIFVKLDW